MDMTVTVGADISGLLAAMGKGEKSLQDFKDQAARFKTALDNATKPESIIRLNRALESANAKMKQISSAGLTKFAGATNTAGQSLQNLGRIAQDAPFGFIGIQNNINPLIESFQRLKTETGSTGKALKSLAGGLVGAGGIGLAVSVLTGVLTVLAQKGFFTAGKASTEAADEIKKFNKSIEDTKAAGISAGLSLQSFVAIARDQTQSLETRNAALEKANKILGDHGDKLTLVNVATQEVTEQIHKFTEATIQQALATKFADRAADLIIKQTEAHKVLNAALLAEESTRKRVARTVGDIGGAAGLELSRVSNQVKDAANVYKLLTYEIARLQNQLTASQLSATKLFGELNGADKITGIIAKLKAQIKDLTDIQPTLLSEKAITENVASIKKLQDELDRLIGKEHHVKKAAETINDVLAKLARQLNVIKVEEDIFHLDKTKDKISAINSAISHLVNSFNQTAQSPIILSLEFQAKEIQERSDLRKLMPKLISKDFTIPVPLEVTAPDTASLDAAMKKLGKRIIPQFEALNQQIADSLKDAFTSSLIGIGEVIGNTIAKGGDLGQAIFGSLFTIVADGLKQIGQALIALGTAKIALEKFNIAPGIGTVIAGIATVAFAALLKAAMPQFATGGFVSGPGTSKSDSIHARLSNGEYVMSAATVSRFGRGWFDMINGGGRPRNGGFASGGMVSGGNIGGGAAIEIFGEFELQGTRLVAVVQRATKRIGRNG